MFFLVLEIPDNKFAQACPKTPESSSIHACYTIYHSSQIANHVEQIERSRKSTQTPCTIISAERLSKTIDSFGKCIDSFDIVVMGSIEENRYRYGIDTQISFQKSPP